MNERRFFTVEQETALADHLGGELGTDSILDAVLSLDLACALAVDERALAPAVRARTSASRAHMLAVLKHASALEELLRSERPLVKTAGLDWAGLDRALSNVIESARLEVEATKPRRGRPPLHWRDVMIAIAYEAYPTGKATRTIGSHFERTVEMLLEFIGQPVEDVHSLVMDALRRQPQAPWTTKAGPGARLRRAPSDLRIVRRRN